jgi:predicted ATP-grasp superfamily ATP-dependent carboligase
VATLAIAALSARLLAQSARRGGYDVLALDLFGDVDTRAVARDWVAIGAPDELRIDGAALLAALADARARTDCFGWIAGAGFEGHPDLLLAGARLLPRFGNDPATIGRVRDPRSFFAVLDRLGIDHPETRFDPPADMRGWLVKDPRASGGLQVRRAGAAHARCKPGRVYFQREVDGRPMSMLFAAAGGRAVPIGVNELLVRADRARPFVYRGAIGPIAAPASATGKELAGIVDALATAFGLRGLASLDVVDDGTRFNVLEINPRPPATLALYDADWPRGLVQAHLDACAGVLPEPPAAESAQIRGEIIVYAGHAVAIDADTSARLLAAGCHDVPQPGSRFAAGAPVCSVSAEGGSVHAVRTALARQESAVHRMVQNRNEAHDHAG